MGRNTREIINLSIGHYSNFIVSHWLNLQESSFVYDKSTISDLNYDVLFREGILPNNQVSYVPRLLIIDAKNSLGSLACRGSLYDPPPDPSTCNSLWSGKVELHCQEKEEKNEFKKALEEEDLLYSDYINGSACERYDIDYNKISLKTKSFDLRNKVKVWSDFLRPHLHPNTIYLLNDVYHQDIYSRLTKKSKRKVNEDERVIQGWSFCDGEAIMSTERTEDEVIDRIRLLSEACDSLQGFHLLGDCHDGMGGVSALTAEYLADDFGSKDLFSFLSTPSYYRPSSGVEFDIFLTNVVQSYNKISEFSSLVVPLSLESKFGFPSSNIVKWPFLSYQEECPFESSAILASFLDTISVPWRHKSEEIPLYYVSSLLTPLNRKFVGGNFSFPLGIDDSYFDDWLNQPIKFDDRIQLRPVSGWLDDYSLMKIAELSSIRGISHKRIGKTSSKYEPSWNLYEKYIRSKDTNSVLRLVSGAQDPIKTSSPFPQMFTRDIDSNGFLRNDDEGQPEISSVPALANLYQGDSIRFHLSNLYSRSSSINIPKLPSTLIGDLEKSSWATVLEEFLTLVKCYGEDSH